MDHLHCGERAAKGNRQQDGTEPFMERNGLEQTRHAIIRNVETSRNEFGTTVSIDITVVGVTETL